MAFHPWIRLQLLVELIRNRKIRLEGLSIQAHIEKIHSGLSSLMIDCIGRVTVTWAILEYRIDNLIDTLHEHGGEVVQSSLPVSLDNKLSYLKDAVRLGVVPAERADAVNGLRASIQSLKTKRHDMIHGIVLYNRETADWTANRSWVKKGRRIARQSRYTIKDVTGLSGETASLSRLVVSTHNLIRRDLGLEDFKDPGD